MFTNCSICFVCLWFCVDIAVYLTNKHDLTTSTAVEKKIGKVPSVQEDKPQKSKSSGEPKEREQQPEGIRLKKVPVKSPETTKQVLIHTAEVTGHHDLDLSVHGLHDRKERDIVTLRRSEQVSGANRESIQSRSPLEVKSVAAVEKGEREIRTRSPKERKEDRHKVPEVEKKIVDCKAKEEEISAKLKPFTKSAKREKDQENIRPKTVSLESKEAEKEVVTQRTEAMRHCDSEVFADKLVLKEDREVKTAKKSGQLPAAQEPSHLGHMEELHGFKEDDEKNENIKAPKTSIFEEPDKELMKTRKNLLPHKDVEQEVVKLKPFRKLQMSETQQPSESKEIEIMTKGSSSLFQRSVAPKGDQLNAHVQPREGKQEVSQRSEPGAARTLVSTPDKKELLASTPSDTDQQQGDQGDTASKHSKPSLTWKTPKDMQRCKETPGKKKLDTSEKEAAEEKIPENQTDAEKKELKCQMPPLLKVAKGKPDEQIQKVELKKTPSPKDQEQKAKSVETDERSSTIRLKKSPQRGASPKEPKQEELHLVKQVSPRAVKVKKVPTQLEEEVFEEFPEKEEEEEVWGWELLPSEGWAGEGLEGAVETPGPPGSKRGEVTVVQPPNFLDPT